MTQPSRHIASRRRSSVRANAFSAPRRLCRRDDRKDAYDDLVVKARTDADAAETELATVRHDGARPGPKLPPLDQVLATAVGWEIVLEGADVIAQRQVLAILIDRIVPVRERQSVYRVDITWTPLGETLRAMTAA